jgi:ABC-type Mn2+/Zn2+ transport system ATPase subunit
VPGRIEGVSFTVRQGSVHALVGPNGSGKSTVMQCVLGLEAHRGSVELTAKRLGVVPQRFSHDGAMSLCVRDFLALTRTRRPVALGLSALTVRRVARGRRRQGLGSEGDARIIGR